MPVYHIHVQGQPAQTHAVPNGWRPASPPGHLPSQSHSGNRQSARRRKSHDRAPRSPSHHRRPSLGLYHEDSFCTACGQDGDEPGEREYYMRPPLRHEDTFNSMFVEDGCDDIDVAHIRPKIEELSDTSGEEITREAYQPPLSHTPRNHPVKHQSDHKKIERVINDGGRAKPIDAILFYGLMCIFIVLLRNIPGLFSMLTGWDNWTGEEIGDAEYDD
ncbi:hypothetical protein TWF696_008612 [Orbilia brochopaga]|uniref:Uncharacterized protein n=1 Tax=Orbilia brochopaga TaxID=3140254 RepID=A0AAV9UGG3_9PEZI